MQNENQNIKIGEKYMHYKTKGVYEILNMCTMQAPESTGLDMCECVIYKKEDDNKIWVRPIEMFLEEVKNENGEKVERFKKTKAPFQALSRVPNGNNIISIAEQDILSNQEIERKFLIKTLPDLTGVEVFNYERYFIYNENGFEIRVQKKGSMFELERKSFIDNLESSKSKIIISEQEFIFLKNISKNSLSRDSYKYSDSISVKKYNANFDGLIRVEVEFKNKLEAESFVVPDWFGPEITSTILGKDSKLINLNKEELEKELLKYKN